MERKRSKWSPESQRSNNHPMLNEKEKKSRFIYKDSVKSYRIYEIINNKTKV